MQLLDRFEIVDSKPAVFCDELDALVVADLHLGIEVVYAGAGTLLPRFQLDDTLDEFGEMREETGASRLIVAGDVMHSFKNERKENEEVERFLDRVSLLFDEVWLVKGNHDTVLEHRIDDYTNVRMDEQFSASGILFVHGHEELEIDRVEEEVVVMGHEHPALSLKDEMGVKEKVPCFLYGSLNEKTGLLVLPAFTRLAEGTSVNTIPKKRFLSPILKEQVDVDTLRAVAVDRDAGLFEFPQVGKI